MLASHPWNEAEKHLISSDPVMSQLIDRYGPCRLEPNDGFFAILCNSIVSQQLATKAAAAIYARFAAYYAGDVSPARVAESPAEDLRALGLSNQKVAYVRDLAAKTLAGDLTPERFPAMPDEDIVKQLVTVKGIGVWTAQMFLIFALNRPDVLPTDDFGVRKAFMTLYRLDAMPGKEVMETIARPWRPWRSIASWYLWRSLENK
ncbi:MAG TPA: DNA-3-methyladenine glycosylase 2 family protein [Selenomonadales bacterium]|nr:DNA-3-methyladenine glycosylase 2 family protein [Selenomonadales bacterium]